MNPFQNLFVNSPDIWNLLLRINNRHLVYVEICKQPKSSYSSFEYLYQIIAAHLFWFAENTGTSLIFHCVAPMSGNRLTFIKRSTIMTTIMFKQALVAQTET